MIVAYLNGYTRYKKRVRGEDPGDEDGTELEAPDLDDEDQELIENFFRSRRSG